MKSYFQRLRTGGSRLLLVPLLGIAVIALILGLHGTESQSAEAPTLGPTNTPKSEIEFLTDEVQQNGVVAVLVTIKSLGFDALEKTPLPPGNPTLYDARIKAACLLADQSRTLLLTALGGYHFKVYGGMGLSIPVIALDVDAATLNFLKNSPLVAGLSIDHVMVIPEEHISPQPLYYTNTPAVNQSGN
jgi:hypothetical protein